MAKILIILTILFSFTPLEVTSAGAYEIKDSLGRHVDIPDAVAIHRLVALGSSMAFVTYLNAQDLVVGVEDLDKTSLAKPYILRNKEQFKDLPVVGKGGAVRIPDYERIIGLKPDVVFIVSTDPGEPDMLQRKLNIPVVAVSLGLPNFDEAIFLQSIELVGKVLGREKRADELVRGVQAIAADLAWRPAANAVVSAYAGGLSYKGNQDIKSTAGQFLPFILAGVKNVADVAGRAGHMFVNKEFLLVTNPELIFIDANGLPLIRQGMATEPDYYARLRALRDGKAWLMLPNTAYFNNPEMLYINAFYVAKAAYPAHYAGLDLAARADELFKLFVGRPLYREFTALAGKPGRVVMDQAELHYAD